MPMKRLLKFGGFGAAALIIFGVGLGSMEGGFTARELVMMLTFVGVIGAGLIVSINWMVRWLK